MTKPSPKKPVKKPKPEPMTDKVRAYVYAGRIKYSVDAKVFKWTAADKREMREIYEAAFERIRADDFRGAIKISKAWNNEIEKRDANWPPWEWKTKLGER